tara:strand:+ start:446 stop:652 length:207 start_codon:yes stop_codon:yes gene_type:complete
MSDKTKHSDKNSLISKFSIAGISEESLNNAEDAAKLLCKQACPVNSSALDPRHFTEYQDFLFELSRKT